MATYVSSDRFVFAFLGNSLYEYFHYRKIDPGWGKMVETNTHFGYLYHSISYLLFTKQIVKKYNMSVSSMVEYESAEVANSNW